MLDTIGDRLNQLLRERGRNDRNEAYTQVDLTDMLTGRATAPNGQRYNIRTNKSTINRILTDKQEPPLEIIFAICDIFNQDLRWILRGDVAAEPPALAWSEEAEIIAGLVDSLLPRSRRLVEIVARNLLAIDNEQRENEKELIELLMENINLLPNGAGKIAKDYIDRAAHRSG